MSKIIWKFPLEIKDVQIIRLPINHKILTVQLQNRTPCLWVMVNPEVSMEEIVIEIIGTGNPIEPGEREYISTFQLFEGELVYHVFKRL